MTRPVTLSFVLKDRDDLTDRLAIFRLAPADPEGTIPAFEAGQHVAVVVPSEQGKTARRPLSIASPPEERRWLEFLVSRSGKGADLFVERLWSLAKGNGLRLGSEGSGRLGADRTTADDPARWYVLVASGTGIAPFASMVRSWTHRGCADRLSRTVVLHGVARPRDLAYRDVFREHVGPTHYLPSLSRPSTADSWNGLTGRVETHLMGRRLEDTEKELGLPVGTIHPDRATVFVCGFRETVENVAAALAPRGFDRAEGALRTEY